MTWTSSHATGRLKRAPERNADNALIPQLVSQVSSNDACRYLRQIAGADLTVVGGDLYRIETRHTSRPAAIGEATERIYQQLQALGLKVSYKDWSLARYSGRNVVGELAGGVHSNEVIVVVAHLDDMPNVKKAPGADDNASGAAGVLVAAEILARYRFERTIRFLFVTGEEQGLLGSNRYAEEAFTNGDQIAAVLNLDMISWDSDNTPSLRVHTRTAANPGYGADLAIFQAFSNVVSTCGLAGRLMPILTADGETASDHSSFWDRGYAAILAMEDDYSDFTPYYHTTNDTVSRVNVTYFTDFVKAALGTTAQLAVPVRRSPFDLLQVDNGDWIAGSGLGVGTAYWRHEEGATEMGNDGRDIGWSNAPANPNAKWLKIHTAPYGVELMTDARPTNSQTIFHGILTGISSNNEPFSCTNRLRFSWIGNPESNRIYSVRVQVPPGYTAGSSEFNVVTNLRAVVDNGGYLDLPSLVNLTNGAVYGTCDVGCWLLATDPADFPLRMSFANQEQVGFGQTVQASAPVVDRLEASTNLTSLGGWIEVGCVTNNLSPDAQNFELGRQEVFESISQPFSNAAAVYFRFQRRWLK